METNMGGLEQAIRFLLGVLILVYAALNLSGVYMIASVIIGALLLATGGIGYCPAYAMLKPKKKESNIEYRSG